MIKIRVKDLHDASIRMFLNSSYEKKYDKLDNREKATFTELFNRTKAGVIKGFYLISDTEFKAIHKSTKNPGLLQLSSGHYYKGELIPDYDRQMENAKDLLKEFLPPGNYSIIQ